MPRTIPEGLVTSIRAALALILCAAALDAQSDTSGAPPMDVFRRAPRVVATDTSTAGTDVFRRASVRREMATRGQVDSVVIDGARVPLDTAHAEAVVSRDDVTEHLARPVKNRPPVADVPVVPPPAPAPAPRAVPTPVATAPAPVAPTPAPIAAAPAPVVPTAAPVVAVVPAPAPARRTPVARATPKPASMPTVKAPPLPDSAQMVREVAELQRDVAPKLHSVSLGLDSVRDEYQARLDRLQREAATIKDTLERKWLDSTIAVARWRNDSAVAPSKVTATKKGKKAKAQND
jgi:hypothetical protein